MVSAELAPLFKFISLFLGYAKRPPGLVDLAFRVDLFEHGDIFVTRRSFALSHRNAEPYELFNTTVDCEVYIKKGVCSTEDLTVFDEYDGYSLIVSSYQTGEDGIFRALSLDDLQTPTPNQPKRRYVYRRPVEADIGLISVMFENGTLPERHLRIQTLNRLEWMNDSRIILNVNAEMVYGFDQCLLQRYRTQGTGSSFSFTTEKTFDIDPTPNIGSKLLNLQYCFVGNGFLRSQFFSLKFMEFYIPDFKRPPGYSPLAPNKAIVQVVVFPKPLREYTKFLHRAAQSDMAVIRLMSGCLFLFLIISVIIDVSILHFICRLNPKYQVNLWRTRKTQIKYVMVQRRYDEPEGAFGERITLDDEPIEIPHSTSREEPPAPASKNAPPKSLKPLQSMQQPLEPTQQS